MLVTSYRPANPEKLQGLSWGVFRA